MAVTSMEIVSSSRCIALGERRSLSCRAEIVSSFSSCTHFSTRRLSEAGA